MPAEKTTVELARPFHRIEVYMAGFVSYKEFLCGD
jgi:hypothetical protein